MAAIRFLYFDMGNVLVNFKHEIAYRQMAELCGCTPDEVRQRVFDSGLEDEYERGELTPEEFHAECCRRLGPAERDSLLAAHAEIFSLNVRMLPVVMQLRGGGKRLGVLSNTCRTHWEYCFKRYRILRCAFSVYALSYEMGRMKPDPQIYSDAADLAGVAPEEILFVDDRDENVAAAEAAGMQAVLFRNASDYAASLRDRKVVFNY